MERDAALAHLERTATPVRGIRFLQDAAEQFRAALRRSGTYVGGARWEATAWRDSRRGRRSAAGNRALRRPIRGADAGARAGAELVTHEIDAEALAAAIRTAFELPEERLSLPQRAAAGGALRPRPCTDGHRAGRAGAAGLSNARSKLRVRLEWGRSVTPGSPLPAAPAATARARAAQRRGDRRPIGRVDEQRGSRRRRRRRRPLRPAPSRSAAGPPQRPRARYPERLVGAHQGEHVGLAVQRRQLLRRDVAVQPQRHAELLGQPAQLDVQRPRPAQLQLGLALSRSPPPRRPRSRRRSSCPARAARPPARAPAAGPSAGRSPTPAPAQGRRSGCSPRSARARPPSTPAARALRAEDHEPVDARREPPVHETLQPRQHRIAPGSRSLIVTSGARCAGTRRARARSPAVFRAHHDAGSARPMGRREATRDHQRGAAGAAPLPGTQTSLS